MKPVIAIIGRPNVGKSTLFNCLTRTRDAVVDDISGVTRDRQYGEGRLGNKPFLVIDTGGIGEHADGMGKLITEQAWLAANEADHVFFVVDAKSGLNPDDRELAKRIRTLKNVHLIVNKIDAVDRNIGMFDFHELGFASVFSISSAHKQGVESLIEAVLLPIPEKTDEELEADNGIKVAIIGRPNVGKSTLVNRLLGEDRVVVYDQPGTTTSSIFIPFERNGKKYTLIDTAGVRRRTKIHERVEKFSVIKTMQSIDMADVVIAVFDARESLTEQDLRLLSFIIESGASLVIAINKWDKLPSDQRTRVKDDMDRRLKFVDFAKAHFISALHGSGVGDLFEFVDEAYESASRKLETSELTRILYAAIQQHQPPLVRGHRIKLRYAHAGGHHPHRIIIHGNQTNDLPDSYVRYLNHTFRDRLKIVGAPIQLDFRSGKNPFVKEK